MLTEKGRTALGALTSRFGRRLVLAFAVCALLPLLVFALLAAASVSQQLRHEMLAALHKDARMAGQTIAARLTQLSGDLSLAAELVQRWRSEGNWSDGQALERQVGGRCLGMRLIEGDKVTKLCGQPVGEVPGVGPAELRHLGTGRALLNIDDAGVATLTLAVDPQNAAALRVQSVVDRRFLWGPAELKGTTCEVAVFDVHHRLLYHSSGTPPRVDEFARAAASPDASDSFHWNVDGERHIAHYWRAFLLPQYLFDLVIVQSRSESEALHAERAFVSSFVLTAFATLLVVLLASLVQIRRTLDPIVEMRRATERLASGDLDVRVMIPNDDEIGMLGATFNDMAHGLQENIMRRERTERDLIASRDAALAAARAKAAFVTNVSHEFRTPMSEILGAVEILCQLDGEDLDAREEFSGIALHGAQRLARVLDDVLELEDDDIAGIAPVDVAETLHAAVAQLEQPLRERTFVDCAEDLPMVLADGARLTKSWTRLLDNAIKFSAADTPIVLRGYSIAQQVVVEVVDQGVGIAAEDLEKIFEPFQQVGRDQLTEKAHGTGLGLSLVRSTVESFGGTISARSQAGRGTTFQVRLPAIVPATC